MEESPPATVLAAIKNAPLKMSFLLHFFLASFGMMGYWSHDAYFFYNLLFFLTLFWTMHDKSSVDAPLLCLIIDVISILLDIMSFCLFFPSHGAADRLSAGLAILNLLARPLSAYAVWQVYDERKRASDGGSFPAGQGRGYQDVPGSSYGSAIPAI